MSAGPASHDIASGFGSTESPASSGDAIGETSATRLACRTQFADGELKPITAPLPWPLNHQLRVVWEVERVLSHFEDLDPYGSPRDYEGKQRHVSEALPEQRWATDLPEVGIRGSTCDDDLHLTIPRLWFIAVKLVEKDHETDLSHESDCLESARGGNGP